MSIDRYPTFGNQLVMLFQSWNGLEVWTATTPSGPWTKSKTVSVCSSCYAINGHPEYSTSSSLALTYYATAPADRVYRTSIPWP